MSLDRNVPVPGTYTFSSPAQEPPGPTGYDLTGYVLTGYVHRQRPMPRRDHEHEFGVWLNSTNIVSMMAGDVESYERQCEKCGGIDRVIYIKLHKKES